ncbi:MAG: DUF721 domain-containing protein [Gammaproteobacteria bacterium]|nr:DUF721 domain-containing protein [Gammaproteobacteria bacterium]
MAQITRDLREWLAEPWSSAVRVANVRGDTLVIFCSNAAALTRLRYRQAELLSLVRLRHGLACTRLEAKVKPAPPTVPRAV